MRGGLLRGMLDNTRERGLFMADKKNGIAQRVHRWLMKVEPPWLAGLAAAAVVAVLGGIVVLVVPEVLGRLFFGADDYPPAVRAAGIDSLRTGTLAILALGSIAAWVIQYRQDLAASRAQEFNERLMRLSQNEWHQVAAIRDLEQIAGRDSELRTTTLFLLAVFVRDSAPREQDIKDIDSSKPNKGKPGGKERPTPGVQEALRVIGDHLGEWAEQPKLTQEDVDEATEDAELSAGAVSEQDKQDNYISLADIAVPGASLRRAGLRLLNLRRSVLKDARLEYADLSEAKLREAHLSHAHLNHTILVGANMRQADLRDANLQDADLRQAALRGAKLQGAKVQGAHFAGADLSLDLSGVEGDPHCMPEVKVCPEKGVLTLTPRPSANRVGARRTP